VHSFKTATILFISSYQGEKTSLRMKKVVMSCRHWQLCCVVADNPCWWVHRGRGSCVAYETLCVFWVWPAAWRTALHYAGWQALLSALFWCHVCRVLWLMRGANWCGSGYCIDLKMK
jgi:hypothetical protein